MNKLINKVKHNSDIKEPLYLKSILKSQSSFLFVIIVVLCISVFLVNSNFLSLQNITNLFKQISVTGICSIAMAIVLLSGGFDLSVGSLVSFVACLIATLINSNIPEGLAILFGILCGTLCGALNGFVIAKSNCAPVIISLGTMGVFKGAALLIAKGNIVNFKVPVKFFDKVETFGIPTIVFIYIFVVVIVFLFLKFTIFGRRIYAIGSNEEASFLSGINIVLSKILIYTISGFIVSLAAIALLMRLGSASAVMGDSYTLNAVASAVIGGIAISGGKGTIGGCFLGILLLGIISNAMNILGVTAYLQQIILGTIVVIAAVVSQMGNTGQKS
jgi:ribose transport system permease protein